MKYLKTSDIAHAVHVHPNTVRLYEEWGLLPPVGRGSNGYRLFTQMHLEQVKLVRLSTGCTFLGGRIRRQALDLMHSSAEGHIAEALRQADRMLAMIGAERRQAEEAEKYLEEWARDMESGTAVQGAATGGPGTAAEIRAAARTAPDQKAETAEDEAGGSDEAAGLPPRSLSIRETADLLDVSIDMLRDWERNGLIHIPRSPENGYRRYGPHEINKLRVLRLLRRSRYGNMSILRVLQQLDAGESENLREIIDTPEFDAERGYLCFTDHLLTALEHAERSANDMIVQLKHMSRLTTDNS
jgi:DNA-binding transcriptional MerR regulator